MDILKNLIKCNNSAIKEKFDESNFLGIYWFLQNKLYHAKCLGQPDMDVELCNNLLYIDAVCKTLPIHIVKILRVNLRFSDQALVALLHFER